MDRITVEITVNVPASKVWESWTDPKHITKWNSGHPDWHTPSATNDVRVGGLFSSRMEAKDGSMGFDFAGTYTEVVPEKRLAYTFGDRTATVDFVSEGNKTKITETFDPETENPVEMQKAGWQTILDNFKKYTEAL
jgi:uncharacterized protein YndB with AHSA1/START domain